MRYGGSTGETSYDCSFACIITGRNQSSGCQKYRSWRKLWDICLKRKCGTDNDYCFLKSSQLKETAQYFGVLPKDDQKPEEESIGETKRYGWKTS